MGRMMILTAIAVLLAACGGDVAEDATEATAPVPAAQAPEAPAAPVRPQVYTYSVVNEFPHGTGDFTQGLFIANGVLYETTGRVGQSTLIRHDVLGDAAAHRQPLPATVFGEGSTVVGDRIIAVTWRAGLGIVYDLETLEQTATFPLAGEGWGLTTDGDRLILSDGSNKLRFIDPETFEETGAVTVTANGKPVPRLNELEYI
ncbi:MAG: glutaminyl-peptide cyclotransferase, partial [Pseudomonadota bacterium]